MLKSNCHGRIQGNNHKALPANKKPEITLLDGLTDEESDTFCRKNPELKADRELLDQKSYIFRKDGSTEIIPHFEATLTGEDVLPGFTFSLRLLMK